VLLDQPKDLWGRFSGNLSIHGTPNTVLLKKYVYVIHDMSKYYVFWYYPLSCLCLKHCHVYFSKHNVLVTGFCPHLQVKPTQLGPIDRASPYLWTSCIDWAKLNRFDLKMETESSLRNVVFWKINRTVFLDEDRMMDNVPSSQTFRSYFHVDFIDLHDKITVLRQ
jgi:hypothetical protein